MQSSDEPHGENERYDIDAALDGLIEAARRAGLGDEHPIVRQALEAKRKEEEG